MKAYRNIVKRTLDILFALFGLLLLSPLVLILAVFVYLKIGSPILFTQTRPGLHGRPFKIYKFRTMTDECDDNGNLLPDAERLTRFGRFLRSTSLDELPELFNVLQGNMSLVGPRPLLTQYLDRYTPEQARRHEVRPGITGWAQVHGWRGDTSIEKRIEFDLYYIQHWSVWLDVKIMWMTVFKGFVHENAY